MSKELFEQASDRLYEKMAADGVTGIMRYKPFSDEYWTESPRIVLCNYENFGYQDCDTPNVLTYKTFKWWFDERENKSKKRGKSKTVHYSAVFVNALLKTLRSSPPDEFSYEEMRKSFWQYDTLYQAMKNVMYMNLRPTSASGNRQEINKTHALIRTYKNEMKAYLEALDADIFIISTKDAAGLFNFIFDLKDRPLGFKKITRMNTTTVVSVKHFGRPHYRYWFKTVHDIKSLWDHD